MAQNSIKVFDNFEGIWKDVIGSADDTIAYTDASGWIGRPKKDFIQWDDIGGGYLDASRLASGNVSNAEYNYLDGVTSNIQTQINSKQDTGVWIDCSTQSVSGYTGSPTKLMQYKVISYKTIVFQFQITGTGSGGSASITLPFTSSSFMQQIFPYHAQQSTTAIGVCSISASTSTLNLYPTASIGANFSNGQARNLSGTIIINIA